MNTHRTLATLAVIGGVFFAPPTSGQTSTDLPFQRAQGAPEAHACGLQLTPEMAQIALANQAAGLYTSSQGAAPSASYDVKIAYHIVQTPFSTNNFSPSAVGPITTLLNDAWAGSGFSFYQHGFVDIIQASGLTVIDNEVEADQLRNTNVVANAINIYIVDDIQFGNATLAGLSSFTMSPVQGIIIDRDFTPTEGAFSTIPHEVGHYFDLYHTHEIQFGCENPDGSDCATAGDLICDTPASTPFFFDGLTLISLACVYTPPPGDFTDCGTPGFPFNSYSPSISNYMSSAYQDCRDEFTLEQFARARNTYLNLRPELHPGATFDSQQELNAQSPQVDDLFGSSVAVAHSGSPSVTSALIGVPQENGLNGTKPDAGAVYAYDQLGANWAILPILRPSNGSTGDRFGTAVAYDGFTAAITARNTHGGKGSVYIYERQGPAWVEMSELVDPASLAGEAFGTTVDIHGDWAAVGAPERTQGGLVGAGGISLFRRDSQVGFWTWVHDSNLSAQDFGAVAQFGKSVAISGSTMAVGSPSASIGGGRLGAVYLFEYDGSQWVQTLKIPSPSPNNFSLFGESVSIYENTLLVGAPADTTHGFNAGQAYFYERVNGVWTLGQVASALAPAQEDSFGRSVSMEGNIAVIGAPGTGVGVTPYSGAVYRFSRNLTTWILDERVRPPFLGADDQYGLAVAIEDDPIQEGSHMIVGAPFSDRGTTNAGIAMVYDVKPSLSGLVMSTDVQEISVSAGGTQTLSMSGGSGGAGSPYLVLGSFTGTSPGFLVSNPQPTVTHPFVSKHASIRIPLQPDFYFNLTLSNPTPLLTNSIGDLDLQGNGEAYFTLAPGYLPSAAIGMTIYHSFVVLDDLHFASSPASVLLVP